MSSTNAPHLSPRTIKPAGDVAVLALTTRPITALAVFYDGTSGSQATVQRWVQSLHPFGGGFAIDDNNVVTVTEPWCDDQVSLSPGHFLIFAQSGACCWTVLSNGQLDTWLKARPWELPIFPDGEVVP